MQNRTATHYQVRHDGVILYDLPLLNTWRRFELPNPTANTYSGYVTPHARRRLLSALDILIQRSPTKRATNPTTGKRYDFKLAFVTLTIAMEKNLQVKEAYDQLLSKWIRYMRAKQGMKDYVWKAEYQRRGQVHYHVATNNPIPYDVIRWQWNKVQKNAGYLRNFALRNGHYNPNSTDVKAFHNIEKIGSYIAKEMCKDVQNQRTTAGKIWDCSKALKKSRYSEFLHGDMSDLINEALQHGYASEIKQERCTIIKMKDPTLLLSPNELKRYKAYIAS